MVSVIKAVCHGEFDKEQFINLTQVMARTNLKIFKMKSRKELQDFRSTELR